MEDVAGKRRDTCQNPERNGPLSVLTLRHQSHCPTHTNNLTPLRQTPHQLASPPFIFRSGDTDGELVPLQ